MAYAVAWLPGSGEPRGRAGSARAPSNAPWHKLPCPPGKAATPESEHLLPPKLLPDNDLLGLVNPVNLEHVLGEIKTNRGNLHVDGSLM